MNVAVYDALFEQLGANEDAIRLRQDLSSIRPGQTIREAVIHGFTELLSDDPPAQLRYEAFARHFPRRPLFSMQPYDEFLLKLVRIASLLRPGEPWYASATSLVEEVVGGTFLERNPVARPLLEACDRNLLEFFRVFMSARAAVLSFADVSLEEIGPGLCKVSMHASCARALSWPFPWGFQGVMRFLGCVGKVTIVQANDLKGVLEMDVRWSVARG